MMERQVSILYNLKPEGLENGFIESLSSYIIRISYKHNVYVGDLINRVIIPRMGKEYLKRSAKLGGNTFFDGAKTLNGFNINAKETIQVMEQLTTRMDLVKLTLDNFKNAFSNRELFNDYLSWCPMCVKEWCSSEREAYYPLIWYVKLVEKCPLHNVKLSTKCYYCNNRIKILSRTISIGRCTSCNAELSYFEQLVHSDLAQKETWYDFCIQNIMFILSDEFREMNLKESSVGMQLQKILEQYFNGNLNEFSKFSEIPKTTLRSWIKRINKPTVQGIFMICFKLNINIYDFFRDIDKVSINYESILPVKKYVRCSLPLDYELLKNQLNEVIAAEIPISMTKAAELLSRDKRVLYENFPNECKQISRRYNIYLSELNETRIMKLKNEVTKAFENLLLQGVFPSRAKIEKKLNLNSIFREHTIKEHWKELLIEYKLEKRG